jgi:hypothetical protein
MVEILFGLFVGNSNEEFRRITVISIPKTAAILLFLAHPNLPLGFKSRSKKNTNY